MTGQIRTLTKARDDLFGRFDPVSRALDMLRARGPTRAMPGRPLFEFLLVVGPYRTGPDRPSRRNLECICSLSK